MAGNGKVGNLFFGINLDSKEFKKGMRQVKRNMKQFQKDMKNGFADVAKSATALTGAVAGLTAGAFALAKSTSELVNAQNILAESLGSTQAEIAGLELAADTMGVSYDMLIDKMREFGGVDEFKKLADDVMNAGDATAQLAKAQEIFGNEGLKLLPILQQGSQGLNDYVTEARKLGLALSPDQVDQMTGAWGKFEKAMQKITGLTRQTGLVFSESFGEFSELIGNLIENNLPSLVAGITVVWGAFKVWFENMLMGIELLLDGFGDLTQGVTNEFSLIELAVIGLTHPFETVLMGIIKITEKILSVISAPFRKIMAFFSLVSEGILKVISVMAKALGDGKLSKMIQDFADDAGLATRQYRESLDAFNNTGAFDGVLFGGFQDDYIAQIKKTAKATRKEYNLAFKGFGERFSSTSENGAQTGKADTESKISGMATLAVAGSIEAFKLENQTENQILDVNKQQLRELKNMTRQQQLQVAGFTS